MRRIALGLEYDGRAYVGWQSQPNGAGVQDAVERALSAFVGTAERIPVVCAGRTDAGVHALGQVVHCDVDVERAPHAWVRGVAASLPMTVGVRWAREVPMSFHARFSAMRRAYRYRIHNAPVRSPLLDGRVGWCMRPLDIDAMRAASRALLGEHDFSSFRSAECQAKSPIKTIHAIDIARRGDLVEIAIAANAFLHHMVRNIVGALVEVGVGRKPAAWVGTLRDARDRTQGAPTLAAAGLYFACVHYPDEFAIPVDLPGWWDDFFTRASA